MPGLRIRGRDGDGRREDDRSGRRRRSRSPLWLLFWLILLIIVLGLIFGGYRKGTPVNQPGRWVPVSGQALSG